MKLKKNTGHSISSLFSLLLFSVFALFLMLMLLFSARVYQQTVKQTDSDSQASASAGTSISQLSDFQAENLDNGFYRISLKSATGISAHFLLHSTAESSVTGTDAGKKEAS